MFFSQINKYLLVERSKTSIKTINVQAKIEPFFPFVIKGTVFFSRSFYFLNCISKYKEIGIDLDQFHASTRSSYSAWRTHWGMKQTINRHLFLCPHVFRYYWFFLYIYVMQVLLYGCVFGRMFSWVYIYIYAYALHIRFYTKNLFSCYMVYPYLQFIDR